MLNRWALITGASQGIGHEFAKLFAADGWHLVLVARDEARLKQIAPELSVRGNQVKILVRDLAQGSTPEDIFTELQREQIFISALVNNAGFGVQGAFAQVEAQRHLDVIQVNITALVQLTHLFMKPMLARREGRILNVASIAAFQPGPFFGVYYASKAFVYSWSCALAKELEGSGVTVTTLCPGITQSQFHARAGLKRQAPFVTMTSAQVAKIGYRGMMQGKSIIIPGVVNKIGVPVAKALPTRWTMRIAARINGPG